MNTQDVKRKKAKIAKLKEKLKVLQKQLKNAENKMFSAEQEFHKLKQLVKKLGQEEADAYDKVDNVRDMIEQEERDLNVLLNKKPETVRCPLCHGNGKVATEEVETDQTYVII